MAFLAGPRQVGKTALARQMAEVYLNFDNLDDRAVILRGPAAVKQECNKKPGYSLGSTGYHSCP